MPADQPAFALTDSQGEPLEGWTVVDGPWDVGSEERWRLQLADGTPAVLARLSPSLARDESLRRRWVRDVERLTACAAKTGCIAPILSVGPQPDPRDPGADPPWRLRSDPAGERFWDWLQVRAPAPIDEVAQRGAALADALFAIHSSGAVLRDLHPRDILWLPDQRVVLTDVGLARVDLLSSHTASSLLVSGSAYAAPEQLTSTAVDPRADLYALGVMLWQALTGALPFGEDGLLLRERVALPSILQVRPGAPPVLDVLLHRLLAERPEERPESAAEVAWVLRGGAGWGSLERPGLTVCQHCGAPLRLGQRLCLACGRVGVRFEHSTGKRRWGVELRSLSEDAEQLAALREFVVATAEDPRRVDEFVTGDWTMYSERELTGRKRLPARFFNDLDQATATALVERMRERGLDGALVSPYRARNWTWATLLLGVATTVFGVVTIQFGVATGVIATGIVIGVLATLLSANAASSALADQRVWALHRLRATPAALPASDPLVARIARLLSEAEPGLPTPTDVRAQLGELALLVQRLVDRRAELTGLVEAKELDLLTEPVTPLLDELERQVVDLARLDRELAELDEGAMVRALAALDARERMGSRAGGGSGEQGKRALERERLLQGLDRLRALEDARAAGLHRLLQASNLLRRAIDLGLEVQDPAAEQERRVAQALAALEPFGPDGPMRT